MYFGQVKIFPPNSKILGMCSCISLLLKWGGDPDVSDNDGQTALFISLCEGYRECVDILIDAGSSLKIVTKVTHHTHTHTHTT